MMKTWKSRVFSENAAVSYIKCQKHETWLISNGGKDLSVCHVHVTLKDQGHGRSMGNVSAKSILSM